MDSINFITLTDALTVHQNQIDRFGSSHGVRDPGLLISALHSPQSTFSGKYLHTTIYAMAAAYAYGIIKNHPFVDGNKRTGALCALIFLKYNNIDVTLKKNELYELGINIATSKLTIKEISHFLKQHSTLLIKKSLHEN